MKKVSIVFLAVIVLSACSTSANQSIATEPAPTSPPPATSTDTPVPTEAPTETPIPSPTPDLRVISADPKSITLITEDLPQEGNYYISQDKGNISNEMIVYHFTQQLGASTASLVDSYLEETNRLDGYSQVWTRGSWEFDGPLYVANEIAIFKTAHGAELEVTQYKPLLINAMDGRKPSHEEIQIGDQTRIYLDTVISNGQEADVILVEFSYRNIVVDIGCWGEKGKYSIDDVLAIAENVFLRIRL